MQQTLKKKTVKPPLLGENNVFWEGHRRLSPLDCDLFVNRNSFPPAACV